MASDGEIVRLQVFPGLALVSGRSAGFLTGRPPGRILPDDQHDFRVGFRCEGQQFRIPRHQFVELVDPAAVHAAALDAGEAFEVAVGDGEYPPGFLHGAIEDIQIDVHFVKGIVDARDASRPDDHDPVVEGHVEERPAALDGIAHVPGFRIVAEHQVAGRGVAFLYGREGFDLRPAGMLVAVAAYELLQEIDGEFRQVMQVVQHRPKLPLDLAHLGLGPVDTVPGDAVDRDGQESVHVLLGQVVCGDDVFHGGHAPRRGQLVPDRRQQRPHQPAVLHRSVADRVQVPGDHLAARAVVFEGQAAVYGRQQAAGRVADLRGGVVQFVQAPVHGAGRGRNGAVLRDGLPHGGVHAFDILDVLDLLVHPVLDEDLLEPSGPEAGAQVPLLDLQFRFEDLQQPVRAVPDHVRDGGHSGMAVADDQEVGVDGDLAGREGVQAPEDVRFRRGAVRPDLDLHVVGGVVGQAGHRDALRPGRFLDRLHQAFRRFAEGQGADHYRAVLPGRQPRTGIYAPVPVVIFADVHEPAGRKIGEEMERLALEAGHLGFHDLDGIVGQDAGGHAHGDALGAQDERHRDLGGEDHGLAGAAVVGVHVLCDVRAEQHLPGKRREPAFDVPRRRGLSPGEHRPEIALLVDEQVLVGQRHQGAEDGLVAVGMELHRLADDVGHLVVLAVVDLEERVEDAALDGLQAVVDFGNRPVLDDVGGVFEEVAVV